MIPCPNIREVVCICAPVSVDANGNNDAIMRLSQEFGEQETCISKNDGYGKKDFGEQETYESKILILEKRGTKRFISRE